MIKCNACDKEISKNAAACPFCGEPNEFENSELEEGTTADYGLLLLLIPVVSTMLIWFWVSNMNLFQSPGNTLTLIMLATVLGTAIVAALEANSIGMKSDREKGTYSPTAWFFIITLFWIIGYPVFPLLKIDGFVSRPAFKFIP